MAFAPRWTPEADGKFLELQAAALASLQNRKRGNKAKATKAEGLFKQVEKCVGLLLENPRHPGLKTHEYDSIQNLTRAPKYLKPTFRIELRGRTVSSGATGPIKARSP